MRGSYYSIPKARFYLLQGDYRGLGLTASTVQGQMAIMGEWTTVGVAGLVVSCLVRGQNLKGTVSALLQAHPYHPYCAEFSGGGFALKDCSAVQVKEPTYKGLLLG